MTAKRFLEQAFWLDKKIEKKCDEIARMRANLEKSNSHISDMPRGGDGSDWTDADIKVLELEEEIRREISKLCELKRQIGEAIDMVDNGRYRMVLELRYRNYMTFEEIAAEMHYSWRQVIRIHMAALKVVVVPDDNQ